MDDLHVMHCVISLTVGPDNDRSACFSIRSAGQIIYSVAVWIAHQKTV